MERFIPMEIFQKKVTPFEVLPFSRSLSNLIGSCFDGLLLFPIILPKRPKFFGPFIWLTSARLPLEAEGD